MSEELCGIPTKSGKPCNMPKNHSAQFHRNRSYDDKLYWSITNTVDNKVLERGEGRAALGYALTRSLRKSLNLDVKISTQTAQASDAA